MLLLTDSNRRKTMRPARCAFQQASLVAKRSLMSLPSLSKSSPSACPCCHVFNLWFVQAYQASAEAKPQATARLLKPHPRSSSLELRLARDKPCHVLVLSSSCLSLAFLVSTLPKRFNMRLPDVVYFRCHMAKSHTSDLGSVLEDGRPSLACRDTRYT